MNISDRIKDAREAMGLTQQELADRLQTSGSLVSAWERGETAPRGSSRIKLAKALKVRAEWLRSGQEPMQWPDDPVEIEYDTRGLMRWMITQPDLMDLRVKSPEEILKIQAERGSDLVDQWHRDQLEFRLQKIAKEFELSLPENKRKAIIDAAWEEGEGWGTNPEDDQLRRYIRIALT